MSNIVENWPAANWDKINGIAGNASQPGQINLVMHNIRILESVLPTLVLGNDAGAPGDSFDKNQKLSAGKINTMVTLTKSFSLATVHVQDPNLTMALQQVAVAAQALALAEDALFFQGAAAATGTPTGTPPAIGDVAVEVAEDIKLGLLDRSAGPVITVDKVVGAVAGVYGINTLNAVIKGISQFAQDGQAAGFALFLHPATFADAQFPLQDDSIVTPASAIEPLLIDKGLRMSPGLPQDKGLLVSLGSMATTLYIGTGPIVTFVGPDPSSGSQFLFNATESIQLNVIDPRSLIKLQFL